MEKQIKILIADDNLESKASMLNALSKDNNFHVMEAKGGIDLLSKAKTENPDVIIMDLILNSKDGFSVIEELRESEIQSKIIITTALVSDMFVAKAMGLGVCYYMIKPIDTNILLQRINEVLNPSIFSQSGNKEFKNIFTHSSHLSMPNVDSKNKYIEEKITNIFITVGIPAHIKGYQFLREAIKMAIDNPDIINSITKRLYPSIAERF